MGPKMAVDLVCVCDHHDSSDALGHSERHSASSVRPSYFFRPFHRISHPIWNDLFLLEAVVGLPPRTESFNFTAKWEEMIARFKA
jgi:hypothetical protein